MPASRFRVLVSGAGIAGLAAAIALGRAGHDVEIVEVRSEEIPEGVGLCLPGNALRALRFLGVLDATAAAGYAYDRNVFCDSDGEILVTIPCRITAHDTPATIGIRRNALHQILQAAAEQAGARISYQTTIDQVVTCDDTALVRFTGGQTDYYDLVVGAEGVHSTLREYVAPASKPLFAGAAAWRVTVPRHESITAGTLYCSPSGRAGMIPLDASTMYFFVIARASADRRPNPRTLHRELADLLGGYGGLFAAIRDQLNSPDGIVYSSIEDILLPAPWHRGRVLLIGDSAHATTPYLTQGAAMALEDGVMLSALLAGARPLPQSLEEFQQHRYERCRFVQCTSLRLLQAEVADPTADRSSVEARIRCMPDRIAAADAVLDRTPSMYQFR